MIDRKTRGRTAPGRLRALDDYLLLAEAPLLLAPPPDAAFVDVGFGEHPATLVESAAALRAVAPGLPFVGLERDPARAAAALPLQDPRTRFLEGGFDALPSLGPARIVRAMNVLRTYREEEVPQAHALLGATLIEGGLLLEGSADPKGAILTAHLFRRRQGALHREALLFFTDFSHGFAPLLFRDWLPRDLRRRVRPGEPIHALFQAWTDAWSQIRAAHPDPRDAFSASVQALARVLPEVDVRWLSHGYVRFQSPCAPAEPAVHAQQHKEEKS
jgi:hypothetical protein